MSNTQFYFALGVPFFTVMLMFVVSTISNRSAITELGKRINDMRNDMNARFGDMNVRFNEVNGRLDRVENRLEQIESAVRVNHEARLATLEAHVFRTAS